MLSQRGSQLWSPRMSLFLCGRFFFKAVSTYAKMLPDSEAVLMQAKRERWSITRCYYPLFKQIFFFWTCGGLWFCFLGCFFFSPFFFFFLKTEQAFGRRIIRTPEGIQHDAILSHCQGFMGKTGLWKTFSVVVHSNTYHLLACGTPVRSYTNALCQRQSRGNLNGKLLHL